MLKMGNNAKNAGPSYRWTQKKRLSVRLNVLFV